MVRISEIQQILDFPETFQGSTINFAPVSKVPELFVVLKAPGPESV